MSGTYSNGLFCRTTILQKCKQTITGCYAVVVGQIQRRMFLSMYICIFVYKRLPPVSVNKIHSRYIGRSGDIAGVTWSRCHIVGLNSKSRIFRENSLSVQSCLRLYRQISNSFFINMLFGMIRIRSRLWAHSAKSSVGVIYRSLRSARSLLVSGTVLMETSFIA